ncbi:MerR family transcriptional regulator [Paenibacillus methanolicus]|uniref:DNA-binding transcriptional MerR regulator n=1 Tax=Paenibacillus methanolicus TaxID=582686 RepID=A0A5S5C9W2_9BACL|nr:MerR family transcriptional regulator [Paenibacillus methanolicus]TYP74773.1 DNA-binding transcriptional MerR regulator [Paenibacillus methanolicus]
MTDTRKYTVEEVTQQLGITARTLHYYEEVGLLPDVSRTEGRHRLYCESMLARTRHILKLKQVLGASLQEIRDILQAEEELDRLKASYYEEPHTEEERDALLDEATRRLENILGHIDEKMEKLRTLRDGFSERLARANALKRSPRA